MNHSTKKHQTPFELFAKRRDSNRLAFTAIIMVTVINALICWQMSERIGNKPQFVVMDDRTYYLPKSLDFSDAKELHVSQAGLVMESLFDRGPDGLDHPERLKRLCERSSYLDATTLVQNEQGAFEAKKLHQKFELRAVQILQAEDESVRVAVDGQLIRTGEFGAEPFSEALAVKAQLLFVRNPALVINGAFPTLLRSLKIEISPVTNP